MSDTDAVHSIDTGVPRPVDEHRAHSHSGDRTFAALLGVYAAAVGISSTGIKLTDARLPDRFATTDMALLGVATHQITKVLATSPFAGPLRSGLRRCGRSPESRDTLAAVATCPQCLTFWAATGITFASVQAPRQTRVAVAILVTMASSDLLHDLRARQNA